jgi:hypothetical protein
MFSGLILLSILDVTALITILSFKYLSLVSKVIFYILGDICFPPLYKGISNNSYYYY